MIPVQYDPEMHVIRPTPFSHYMQRHMEDSLIFTYQHQRTKNWVLAAWITQPYGRMLELVVLGDEPTASRGTVRRVEGMVTTSSVANEQRAHGRSRAKVVDKEFDRKETEEKVEMHKHWDMLRRKFEKGRKKERAHWVVGADTTY